MLPALYRIADAEQNGQLRALLGLITQQADALHEETRQLGDDVFIETCRSWVIPYIGDLVGNNLLHDLDLTAAAATALSLFKDDLAGPDFKPRGAIRLRADVAKTIYYRRRKGTPAMLEELAHDVTGWGAHVVEFFTVLDWNQHLEHLRLDCHGCPDLRRVDVGDRVGGPWDTATHTVDVRRIDEREGWYNIPNIGFFLWRLDAYPLTRVTPRAIGGTSWRFTFSPLGQDVPLFSSGKAPHRELGMTTELDVEAPIRAAAFFEDLKAVPPVPPAAPTVSTNYYGDPLKTNGSLVVFADGAAVPANEVACTNLEQWTPAFAQPAGTVIRVDIKRGRLVVPQGRAGQTIKVSYHSGFSADMGGGTYDRRKWILRPTADVTVSGGGGALDAAIAGRVPVMVSPGPGLPARPRTIIEIGDNDTYDIVNNITLAPAESLTIQAKNNFRPLLRLANGSTRIIGGGPLSGIGAGLTLSGVLVEGGLHVEADLGMLRLLHSTLVPGRSVLQEAAAPTNATSLLVDPGPAMARINTHLEVQIAFCIVGALRIPAHATMLTILDSIVDGIEEQGKPRVGAVLGPPGAAGAVTPIGPPAHIERSTLFGPSHFLKLPMASELIFTGTVTVEQQQEGCVRFCYVPPGSHTPQRYRCQPALEAAIEIDRRKAEGGPFTLGWEAALTADVERWLVPTFEFGELRASGLRPAQPHLSGPDPYRC